MKRTTFTILILGILSLLITLHATETLVEGKVGYFRATSEGFRDIYGGGAIYGLEISVQMHEYLYGYASGSYFEESGKTPEGTKSTLKMVPVSTGLKYVHTFSPQKNQFYMGLGVAPTYINVENNSPFLIRKMTGWEVGGEIKWGLLFNLTQGFFLDIFGNYLILQKKFSNDQDILVQMRRADFSGLTLGGAVGYRF